MFIACMVDDEVHHQLHISLMHARNKLIDIGQSAELEIDVLEIGYVVAHVDER